MILQFPTAQNRTVPKSKISETSWIPPVAKDIHGVLCLGLVQTEACKNQSTQEFAYRY